MRIAVTGSRHHDDYPLVARTLVDLLRPGDVLVLGDALGVDAYAWTVAKARGVPYVRHVADWATHGRAAGPKRNAAMLAEADLLVAFLAGAGPGTLNCVGQALALGLPVLAVPAAASGASLAAQTARPAR